MRIPLVVLLVLVCSFLTGCFLTNQEDLKQYNRDTAEDMALNYLKDHPDFLELGGTTARNKRVEILRCESCWMYVFEFMGEGGKGPYEAHVEVRKQEISMDSPILLNGRPIVKE